MSFPSNAAANRKTATNFTPVGASTATTAPAFSFGGGDGAKFSFSYNTAPGGTAKTQPETSTVLTPTTVAATTASSAPATTAPAFSFGTPSLAKPGFSLNPSTPASTTVATTSAAITIQPTTSTATSTAATPASVPTSINFVQLEESINKWTLDLEEQEKTFMNQASQINTWDHLLIKNTEKIVALNSDVENVKLEQKKLDHELDFISAQQKELEDCLIPLEKELNSNNAAKDPQRENMYQLAENLDVQLKQMSEDLKEIIEHLNDSLRSQDNSDPIVQIGRILNAHMNSLHWIDQNTLQIQNQLDEITKLQSIYQKESDRLF